MKKIVLEVAVRSVEDALELQKLIAKHGYRFTVAPQAPSSRNPAFQSTQTNANCSQRIEAFEPGAPRAASR